MKVSPGIRTAIFLLPLAVVPLLGKSYDLMPKYREGQRWVFDETQHIRVSSQAIPGGSQKIAVKNRSSAEVVKVYPDGTVDLRLTIHWAHVDNPLFPFMMFDVSKLVNLPIILKIDVKGKVVEVVPPPDLPEDAKAKFEMFKQFCMHHSPYQFAPHRPVEIGEAWKNENTASLEYPYGVVDRVQTTESKLESMSHFLGKQCLQVSFEGEFKGALTQGAAGSVEGTLSGKRMVDEETGVEVRFEMQMSQSVNEVLPEGEVEVEFTVDWVRELSEEDAIR